MFPRTGSSSTTRISDDASSNLRFPSQQARGARQRPVTGGLAGCRRLRPCHGSAPPPTVGLPTASSMWKWLQACGRRIVRRPPIWPHPGHRMRLSKKRAMWRRSRTCALCGIHATAGTGIAEARRVRSAHLCVNACFPASRFAGNRIKPLRVRAGRRRSTPPGTPRKANTASVFKCPECTRPRRREEVCAWQIRRSWTRPPRFQVKGHATQRRRRWPGAGRW